MKLSTFIRDNIELILQQWEHFAREVQPENGDLDREALRDHAKLMVEEIVKNIDMPENKHQQNEKARGRKINDSKPAIKHGKERHNQGFPLTTLGGEYRYLRASIFRLWDEQNPEESLETYELIRFNEAVDQLIVEAFDSYSAEKEQQTRQLSTILSSSSDHAYILDSHAKFANANKSMLDTLNLSLGQVIGKTLSDLHLPSAVKLEDDVKMVLQTAERRVGEVRYTLPSGEERHYEYVLSPVVDREKNVEAVAALEHDVTERNKITESLRKSEGELLSLNQELEQRVERGISDLMKSQKYLHTEKLASIGKLSASIAHEFNNPLQGIITVMKGLKKRAILQEEDKELLVSAIGEGLRIGDLIASLNDFNRPSSRNKALMDIHQTIDSILILQKSELNKKQILLERNYAEGLPQIIAVSDQIKQVLLNLLDNAADACEKHDCVITVSTWQEHDRVAVAIKDTGSGIKQSDMEQIFRPFYTTKSEVKGVGLGLSVSYGIIKEHHGEILVESQPGEGTTFTILLPINGGEENTALSMIKKNLMNEH